MEFVLLLHHTVCEIASLNFSRARVLAACGKFDELAPVLTKMGVSLKLNIKIYYACVQLVYGIKTWAMNAEDLNRLMMVRMMCMWSFVK